MDLKTAKRLLSEEIWNKLETSGVARFQLSYKEGATLLRGFSSPLTPQS
jgi:hypothetical protein